MDINHTHTNMYIKRPISVKFSDWLLIVSLHLKSRESGFIPSIYCLGGDGRQKRKKCHNWTVWIPLEFKSLDRFSVRWGNRTMVICMASVVFLPPTLVQFIYLPPCCTFPGCVSNLSNVCNPERLVFLFVVTCCICWWWRGITNAAMFIGSNFRNIFFFSEGFFEREMDKRKKAIN